MNRLIDESPSSENQLCGGLYELPTGTIIDLGKVIMVGPVVEDGDWHHYTVTMEGGLDLNLLDNRPVEKKRHLKRAVFVEAWAMSKRFQSK